MFKRSNISLGVMIAMGGASAAVAPLAFAQPVERVEITGSRILSTNTISPAPIQTLSAGDIAGSGVINLQELILKNPVFGTPGISRIKSMTNSLLE